MRIVTKALRYISVVFISCFCMSVLVNAQTPADDPGIGGPGTNSSAPAGDGAPIVPYDTNMTILFLSFGIALGTVVNKELF